MIKSKKHDAVIKPGMMIRGKWRHHQYEILRKLGSGAIGTVYLCKTNGTYAALKVSDNNASMTMEVNVLKSLRKVQANRLGPYLLDVDDWMSPLGNIFTFYVMEYIHGEQMATFLQKNGYEWIGVFMLQLLDGLEQLHRAGWVFGDLKLDNLLITHSPPKVRWIDVGGVTQIGRAIKEYTEFYDRGYWGMGSRRAEPSYDLFAFVMIFLNIFYPNRFKKGKEPKTLLFKKLNHVKALKLYHSCLRNALLGKYKSSIDMKREISSVLYHAQKQKQKRERSSEMIRFTMEVLGIGAIASGLYITSLLIP